MIVVLGSGESGVGAAILAQKLGKEVFLSNFGAIKPEYKEILVQNNIPFEEGGHHFDIANVDFVVKSPGVPEKAPIIKTLRKNDIKIISEIEYAAQRYDGKIIAITGSNGKTTTTALTYHLLKNAGLDVAIGGNYGISFAKIVAEQKNDIVVLELSSFQLDDIDTFRPDISVVLNISPDHLDRYEYDIDKYAAAKFRIFENQKEGDVLIYNGDDDRVNAAVLGAANEIKKCPINSEDYINGIVSKDGNEKYQPSIQGRHNLFNARCATEVARRIGVNEEDIANGLKTFVNEPHRLEVVVEAPVKYINDSKATNVDAVWFALDAMTQPVVLMIGGVDKGNDYTQIDALVDEKVKAIVCLGTDNSKLMEHFCNHNIHDCSTIDEAIQVANDIAVEGDTVLLSPACASFDLFKNYIDRGDQFREKVLKITNK